MKKNTPTFWTEKRQGKKVTATAINNTDLIEFWKQLGFANAIFPNSILKLVRITEKRIIEEVDSRVLKEAVTDYLTEINRDDVKELLFKKDFAPPHLLDNLQRVNITYQRDTRNTCYQYYRNAVVRISANRIELIPYPELDGFVWTKQIHDRDFSIASPENGDFYKFLLNVSGQNRSKFESLQTILGYILHDYKDATISKAVIFLDENMGEYNEANGGTGKSILGKAIARSVPTLTKEGKNIATNSRFIFQDLKPEHKVLYYDDVKSNFEFESLYSAITGELTIEEKFKPAYGLKFEDSPKIVISSNFPVLGLSGFTDDRRRIEFELSPYYGPNKQPIDDFGKRFFDEWNSEDWKSFDNCMVYCIQQYLKKGIIEYRSTNSEERKLIARTNRCFVEFANNEIAINTRIDKSELLDNYHTYCSSSQNRITPNRFKKWLDLWANYKGYIKTHLSSNGRNYFKVTEREQ